MTRIYAAVLVFVSVVVLYPVLLLVIFMVTP